MNAHSNITTAFDGSGPTLREALGCFPTGVAVVTTLSTEGVPVGVTCNSFSSVSLDPPLILWSLRRESSNLGHFTSCSHFVVNIMGKSQQELCRRFAQTRHDKFDGVAVKSGVGGAPVLPGAIATFECEKWKTVDAGDHSIFLGQVMQFHAAQDCDTEALVFYRGRFS